jgi:hypothetical protein
MKKSASLVLLICLAACAPDAPERSSSSGGSGGIGSSSGGSGASSSGASGTISGGTACIFASGKYTNCQEYISGAGGVAGADAICKQGLGVVSGACDAKFVPLGCCKNSSAEACYNTDATGKDYDKELMLARDLCTTGRGMWRTMR